LHARFQKEGERKKRGHGRLEKRIAPENHGAECKRAKEKTDLALKEGIRHLLREGIEKKIFDLDASEGVAKRARPGHSVTPRKGGTGSRGHPGGPFYIIFSMKGGEGGFGMQRLQRDVPALDCPSADFPTLAKEEEKLDDCGGENKKGPEPVVLFAFGIKNVNAMGPYWDRRLH